MRKTTKQKLTDELFKKKN